MARIGENAFRQYRDGQDRLTAPEYMAERELIRLAVNDLDDKVQRTESIREEFVNTINEVEAVKGEVIQTKQELETSFGDFTQTVDQELQNKASKEEVNTQLQAKASVTEVQQVSTKLSEAANKVSGMYNVKEFLCDDGQYVKGDGMHDDTTGIQRAFDTARGTLYFPKGIYRLTGQGEACLVLRRNINLQGASTVDSWIRGDRIGNETSIIKVQITDNFGYTDVRNWSMKGIKTTFNGGGKHSILIKDGMPMLNCVIQECQLSGNVENGGHAVYNDGVMAHSLVTSNTMNNLLSRGEVDANAFVKNSFIGKVGAAITFDLSLGVRNNIVRDNTITNRDGAVHIINGDNVRVVNNQIEHFNMKEVSQNPKKTMVWVEGRDRRCENTVISENNFGGGTNLDYLIYIDNAYKAVIEKNYLVAVNKAEVLFTDRSLNCIYKQDNTVYTQPLNPRTEKIFNTFISDSGKGTVGVLKTPTFSNSWEGAKFIKDEMGFVHFYESLAKGTINPGDEVLTLPKYFRPAIGGTVLAYTNEGVGLLKHSYNGKIHVLNLSSNKNVKISHFPVAEDNITNTDFLVYDDFNRADSDILGTTLTGQTWESVENKLKITGNEIALTTVANTGIGFVETGTADCIVQAVFSRISSDYAQANRLVFRLVDSSNYLYVTAFDLNGYKYGVHSVVNGVDTQLFGFTASQGGIGNYANGDNVRIKLQGNSVTLTVNDITTPTKTINSFTTATKHGISIFKSTIARIDTFGVSAL